jgi:ParB/RepB/Spo0J family partition protein
MSATATGQRRGSSAEAVKPLGQAQGRRRKREDGGQSKAVAFRGLRVEMPEEAGCTAVVYIAQDADGRWYGSSSLAWDGVVPWTPLLSVMCPTAAETFDDWHGAVDRQVGRLRDYVRKCRANAPTAELLGRAAHAALAVLSWGEAAESLTQLPGGDVSGKTDGDGAAQPSPAAETATSPASGRGDRRAAQPSTAAETATSPKERVSGRRSGELEIPVEKIHRRPSNRGGVPVEAPEVADLAASIERFGLSTAVEVRAVSEEQDLPVGHYELLKGERRWKAHQVAGRETIRAIVVACDAAEAAAAVAVDNTHRRDLDPIARARGIAAAQAQGLTLEDAGLAHGLGVSATKNALRLLELPASVQAAVTAGKLDQAVAIAAVPLLPVPGVAKELERAAKKGEWWLRRADDARHVLEGRLLQNRAVEITTRKPQPWESDEVLVADPKKLTAADREALGVIELRTGNKPRLLATNLAEVQRRKEAAAEQVEQALQEERRKAKAAGKPANPEAEKQQDESLLSKTKELYYLWLRLLIAEALTPGDPRTLRVIWWLAEARGNYGNPLLIGGFLDGVLAIRGRRESGKRHGGAWQAWSRTAAMIGGDDWITDHEMSETLLAQLILWPVFRGSEEYVETAQYSEELAPPNTIPDSWPELRNDDVASASAWLAKIAGPSGKDEGLPTEIGDGWRAAAERAPHSKLLERWLSYHNGRQLERLARELKVDLDPAAKVSDKRAEIVSRHTERRLPLPKVFAKSRAANGKPVRVPPVV